MKAEDIKTTSTTSTQITRDTVTCGTLGDAEAAFVAGIDFRILNLYKRAALSCKSTQSVADQRLAALYVYCSGSLV
jgi:hypothetical protein